MLYHLRSGYEWEVGMQILSTAVDPIMFLLRCLTKEELHYGPSELEVACLVWACKRLCTTLYSLNLPIVVITDHESTKGIVNRTTLQTTLIDRANRRLVNALIYLSAYPLEIHYLLGRLNLVLDALSWLCAVGDDETRKRDDEPALDVVWDEDLVNLIFAEAKMADET